MLAMLQSRRRLHDALEKADFPEEDRRRVRAEESAWTRYWHASFRKTKLPVLIADRGNRLRLNRIEREILAALILEQLAMFPEHFHDTRGLFKALVRPANQVLEGFRALSEHGRLVKAKLVVFRDPENNVAERTPIIDPCFVDSVVALEHEEEAGWPVKTEAELLERLPAVVRALREKSEFVRRMVLEHTPSRLHDSERKAHKLVHKLNNTLGQHEDWKLSEVRRTIYWREFRIFIMLLGRALGYVEDDEDGDNGYCTGIGLARIVVEKPDEVGQALRLFQPDGSLIRRDLVQPSDGMTELLSTNPREPRGNGI